jgi:transcriptional regulator with XRE-family HTH domain
MEVDGEVTQVIDRIRETRLRRSMSQMELAERADISQSFLAALESGKKSPSVETVLKIAHALGINPGDLFPRATSSKTQIKEEIITLLDSL